MPKGTVYKNHQLVFDQADVRLAGESLFVASVPNSSMPKRFSEQKLRLGILALDLGHVERALGGSIKALCLRKSGHRDFWFGIGFDE